MNVLEVFSVMSGKVPRYERKRSQATLEKRPSTYSKNVIPQVFYTSRIDLQNPPWNWSKSADPPEACRIEWNQILHSKRDVANWNGPWLTKKVLTKTWNLDNQMVLAWGDSQGGSSLQRVLRKTSFYMGPAAGEEPPRVERGGVKPLRKRETCQGFAIWKPTTY